MELKKLDIGSGRPKLAGYITLDKDPSVGADITLDFEDDLSVFDFNDDNFKKKREEEENNGLVSLNYPVSFDEIRAHHILEHFKPENKVKVMFLCWDLLTHGGIIDIEIPLFPHPASVQDPTHISFWTAESFKYFIKGDPFGEAFAKRYSEYPVPLFEKVDEWYKGDNKPYWAYGIKLKKV